MTHSFRLAAIAVLMLVSGPPALAEKLGYLDSAAILRDMPEVEEAETALIALQSRLREEAQSLVESFQRDLAQLQEQAQAGALSDEQQAEQAARMNARRNELQELEGTSARRLRDRRAELFGPIYTKLSSAIKAVADEGGYAFVFDQPNVLYFRQDTDIAAQVRARLKM